jgi:hypothetical protein
MRTASLTASSRLCKRELEMTDRDQTTAIGFEGMTDMPGVLALDCRGKRLGVRPQALPTTAWDQRLDLDPDAGYRTVLRMAAGDRAYTVWPDEARATLGAEPLALLPGLTQLLSFAESTRSMRPSTLHSLTGSPEEGEPTTTATGEGHELELSLLLPKLLPILARAWRPNRTPRWGEVVVDWLCSRSLPMEIAEAWDRLHGPASIPALHSGSLAPAEICQAGTATSTADYAQQWRLAMEFTATEGGPQRRVSASRGVVSQNRADPPRPLGCVDAWDMMWLDLVDELSGADE